MDAFASNVTSAVPLPNLQYPIYYVAAPSLHSTIPDLYLSLAVPHIVYWTYSLVFHLISELQIPYFEKRRIHESAEERSRNRVTTPQVIRMVILQQIIQTLLGYAWLEEDGGNIGVSHYKEIGRYAHLIDGVVKFVGLRSGQVWEGELAQWVYWWGVPIAQFFAAAFLLDGWQYFMHRLGHENKFLYRHFHSVHHRLYVPSAFGALYNHPVEGFVLDTLGAAMAHSITQMSTRQGILFFGLSTMKTVDDHCGFRIPWDPFQLFFMNDVDYHDIHHQIAGIKANYSQPFFIHFDYFLGTRMTRKQFEAKKYRKPITQVEKEVILEKTMRQDENDLKLE